MSNIRITDGKAPAIFGSAQANNGTFSAKEAFRNAVAGLRTFRSSVTEKTTETISISEIVFFLRRERYSAGTHSEMDSIVLLQQTAPRTA